MSWLAWALVIFLTALVTLLGAAVLTGRQPRVPLARLVDPAPLPGELPVAGRLGWEHGKDAMHATFKPPPARWPEGSAYCHENHPGRTCTGKPLTAAYGPFPVDTGPLLILSEQAAANVALEREIRQRCDEAEAKIPPRWR